MRCLFLVPTIVLLAEVGPLTAQQSQQVTSPYAGQTARSIKALSAEDVRRLEAGEGMGFALAAELNSYPGPRHALDLADSLGLTPEQRQRIGEIREAMTAEARRLGALVVAQEAALDTLFAGRGATDARVARATEEIGRLTGRLRAVHLNAHLAVTALLTPEQVHRYDQVRGYGDGGHGTHRH